MELNKFENIVEMAFENLPQKFRDVIENVSIVIEDYPDEGVVKKLKLKSKHQLLGLYQGVSLKGRGSYYGMFPIVPDKISLYKKNIEAICKNEQEIIEKITEVLIHEIGHYFGMTDKEIRDAGF